MSSDALMRGLPHLTQRKSDSLDLLLVNCLRLSLEGSQSLMGVAYNLFFLSGLLKKEAGRLVVYNTKEFSTVSVPDSNQRRFLFCSHRPCT